MADPRNFAKIDLGYFDNPKVSEFVDERPRVPLLHLRAILYCRQHLTDGSFPVRAVVRLACASHCGSQCDGQCDFCAGVDAGLFDRVSDRTGRVHDYLEHQDSAEQAIRRKRAGQKGAAVRWGKTDDANGNADRNANGIADGNAEKRREEKSTSASADAPRPEVAALSDLLADLIAENGSKRPAVSGKWHDAARLMLDRDNRDRAQAEALIRWCQTDEFWRGNVLSMPTFRKQYDKLRLAAERVGALRGPGLKVVGFDAPTPDQLRYADE